MGSCTGGARCRRTGITSSRRSRGYSSGLGGQRRDGHLGDRGRRKQTNWRGGDGDLRNRLDRSLGGCRQRAARILARQCELWKWKAMLGALDREVYAA